MGALELHEELERLAPLSPREPPVMESEGLQPTEGMNTPNLSVQPLSSISLQGSASMPSFPSSPACAHTLQRRESVTQAPPAMHNGSGSLARLATASPWPLKASVQHASHGEMVPAPSLSGKTSYPSSPIPHPRGAGGRTGIFQPHAGSMLSSISLHDRRSLQVATADESCNPVCLQDHRASQGEHGPDSKLFDIAMKVDAPVVGGSPAARRLNELQRQVNELTRLSLRPKHAVASGPLYRLDNIPAGSPEPAAKTSLAQANLPDVSSRASAVVRQIPVNMHRHVASQALDDPNDRFDDYSVHRPKRGSSLV